MRIRDIARIDGFPCGEYNAVTDVKGVRVGHSTVIKDGAGPVEGIARTGVTVVLPAGDIVENAMYAGVFSLNGNGELSGCHWIEESGLLTTPIALTNTHSLGIVRDAMIGYYARLRKTDGSSYWMLPVVGETWDGWLSDINGMHVRPEHLCAALDSAASGPVAEGCVGGGTGMILHEFKGGIGTSSRVLPEELGGYTVGVLIQGNYGKREDLLINGVPVGRHIPTSRIPGKEQALQPTPKEDGSIIIVVATDAPLTPDQCKRLARRAGLGLGRTGGLAFDGSGDIFIAFSTANRLGSNAGYRAHPVARVHGPPLQGHGRSHARGHHQRPVRGDGHGRHPRAAHVRAAARRGARDHAALRIPLEAAAPHPPQRARRPPCSPEKEWANVLKRLKSQVFIVRQPSCRKKDAPRMGSVPHEQGVPYMEALFRHHGRGPLRAEPDRRQRLLG